LLSSVEETPPPLVAESAEEVSARDSRYSYALVQAGANSALFAGLEGSIRAIDLDTGRSKSLVNLPGRPPVIYAAMSRDGALLACTVRPEIFERRGGMSPMHLQVWDYERLRGSGNCR
jgi:hypothetical protein